jgi:hypothetical protein
VAVSAAAVACLVVGWGVVSLLCFVAFLALYLTTAAGQDFVVHRPPREGGSPWFSTAEGQASA